MPGTTDDRDRRDGIPPTPGRPCVSSEHKGYHRAADGSEWLDEH